MKILEYYNNLRKRRIVVIAALALMALVLVVTPLTTHAGTGIYSTDDDGILYVGESMTLTHDFTKSDFYYRPDIGPYFTCSLGANSFIITSTQEKYGLLFEYISDSEIRVTNVSCDASLILNFGIGGYDGVYVSLSYKLPYTFSPKTLVQVKFGSIFDDAATMVTTMLTFMQQFLTFMTANPILLIPLIVFLVGVAIFFLVRLLKD